MELVKLTDDYGKWYHPEQLGLIDVIPDDMTYFAMHIYVRFIERGLRPPDNILLIIAKSFDSYLERNGEITLDKAFGVHAKPRTGSPLKHKKAMAWKQHATFLIWYRRKIAEENGQQIPAIKTVAYDLIEEYRIPHHKTPNARYDEDTLEREYNKSYPELWERMYKSSYDFIQILLENADEALKSKGIKKGGF
jgi:hypothetical protein